jgi:hypothetical protein
MAKNAKRIESEIIAKYERAFLAHVVSAKAACEQLAEISARLSQLKTAADADTGLENTVKNSISADMDIFVKDIQKLTVDNAFTNIINYVM